MLETGVERMKMKLRGATLLVGFTMASLVRSAEPPAFVVRGPTIVAFFPPVKQAELESNPGMNETLADFQFYAMQVREPLRKAGIDFHQVNASSFRIRIGTKLTAFRTGDKVGYYLVAPGKKPRIEHGVETDVGLLEIASEYFGSVAK
jgi:hypothetical protein